MNYFSKISCIFLFCSAPVCAQAQQGSPAAIVETGDQRTVFIRSQNGGRNEIFGFPRRLWWKRNEDGTFVYVNVRRNADEYCRLLGFASAVSFDVNEDGIDETGYFYYDEQEDYWTTIDTPSSNGPYALIDRVVCTYTQTGDCAPASHEVTLYEHINYDGRCRRFHLGSYADPFREARLPPNSVSSIQVGEAVEAELCNQRDFFGRCERFRGSDRDLRNNHLGHDNLESLSVLFPGQIRCLPRRHEASAYLHAAFVGHCRTYGLSEIVNGEIAQSTGLFRNVSSIRLGADTWVRLNDGSETQFVREDTINLEALDFNDKADTLWVVKEGFRTTQDPDCLPGPLEVSFHARFSFTGVCVKRGQGQSTINPAIRRGVRLGSDAAACLELSIFADGSFTALRRFVRIEESVTDLFSFASTAANTELPNFFQLDDLFVERVFIDRPESLACPF